MAGTPSPRGAGQEAATPDRANPIVFIHGLWVHTTSWAPWQRFFEQRGYSTVAPGWPGDADTVEAARADPESVAGTGIDDVVDQYAAVIATLPADPIVVGHSFGGLMAQKLLGRGLAAAAVAVDAAPIKGVLRLPLSSLRSAFPVLRSPANKNRAVSLSAEQFRYGFGNTLDAEESDRLYGEWAVPAPGRPLFEAATANFSRHPPAKVDTGNRDRGPLLLVAGGRDHVIPAVVTRSTLKQYRGSPAVTDLVELADRGHSLTIDHGWQEVADASLVWLEKQGL